MKKFRIYAEMGSELYCDVEAKSIEDIKLQIANGEIDGGMFIENQESGWWEYGDIDEL